MRRIALVPIVLLALAGAALAVTGCGGGGPTDPEDAITQRPSTVTISKANPSG